MEQQNMKNKSSKRNENLDYWLPVALTLSAVSSTFLAISSWVRLLLNWDIGPFDWPGSKSLILAQALLYTMIPLIIRGVLDRKKWAAIMFTILPPCYFIIEAAISGSLLDAVINATLSALLLGLLMRAYY